MVLPIICPFEELLVTFLPDELYGLPAFPVLIAFLVPFLNNITGLPFRTISTGLITFIPETTQLHLALRPVDVTSAFPIAQSASATILVLKFATGLAVGSTATNINFGR
ncbi:hypothetical protein [Methanococcoides methylutens]|uniref:hypothetical protein n=1 Tax=Methanococcoides methylutens TaxID=2226 RepID=UPI00064FD71B|nr:hypothetical protein [Methanococcoides methylutens]